MTLIKIKVEWIRRVLSEFRRRISTVPQQERIKNALLLCSILFLTSCSFLSPVKTPPQCIYIINTTPTCIPSKKMQPITLLVTLPETVPVFNTTQMAYSIKPHQIAYFGLNRWAETPAQMLQPLLTQTLQNTHYFKAVINPPCAGNYDYILCTQILELLQDFICDEPAVKLVVRAQIIQVSTGKVIATKQFFIAEPMMEINPYAGVIAANCATKTLLNEIAEFCLARVRV